MTRRPVHTSNQRRVERTDFRTGESRVYLLTRLRRLTGRTEAMRVALFDARSDDSNAAKDAIYADVSLDWNSRSPDGFNYPFYEDEFGDPFYGDEEIAGILTWCLRRRLVEAEARHYVCKWKV